MKGYTHTLSKDNLIELKNPEPFIDDPITEILRNGAKKLLADALEVEIKGFLSQYADLKDDRGAHESYPQWLPA
jgi:putative transposase